MSTTLSSLSATRNLRLISSALFRFTHTAGVYKLLFWILLLINFRSLPFAWHIRIFRPAFVRRFQYYLLRLSLLLKPRSVWAIEKARWFESIAPIGANPLEHVTVYKTWASIDDCDFMGHLSNSSYAKTLDAARLKASVASFPFFFRAGGWLALAATHYTFIREIPMFAPYEVQLCTVGWDNKWLFLIARVITYSKTRKPPKRQAQQSAGDSGPGTPGSTILMYNAPVHTSSASDGVFTPASTAAAASTEDALRSLTAHLAHGSEDDGRTTLHCISISQLCFKHGRITVPPAVVFASNGYSTPPSSEAGSSDSYSHKNLPPHWTSVRSILNATPGSMKPLAAFLRGGWRDVPETERWWEDAMGGVVEEKRRVNMEILDGVRRGVSEAAWGLSKNEKSDCSR